MNSPLGGRAEDAHQMYSRGSVVNEATIIRQTDRSRPRPLILTGDQKVRNMASLSTPLVFERPTFENAADISTLKQTW